MTERLRLFTSAADAAEDARLRRVDRAQDQPRCTACGRFTRSQSTFYGGICAHCITEDRRPAIRRKVDQAKRWWKETRH